VDADGGKDTRRLGDSELAGVQGSHDESHDFVVGLGHERGIYACSLGGCGQFFMVVVRLGATGIHGIDLHDGLEIALRHGSDLKQGRIDVLLSHAVTSRCLFVSYSEASVDWRP
jgi:hypothetical protein